MLPPSSLPPCSKHHENTLPQVLLSPPPPSPITLHPVPPPCSALLQSHRSPPYPRADSSCVTDLWNRYWLAWPASAAGFPLPDQARHSPGTDSPGFDHKPWRQLVDCHLCQPSVPALLTEQSIGLPRTYNTVSYSPPSPFWSFLTSNDRSLIRQIKVIFRIHWKWVFGLRKHCYFTPAEKLGWLYKKKTIMVNCM